MKKYIAIACMTLLMGVVIAFGVKEIYLEREGFKITFQNETETETPDLFLSYKGSDGDIQLRPISPGNNTSIHIKPLNVVGENSMTLFYKDEDGKIHKEKAISYFEKGYFGTITVIAKSIDSKGIIDFEFKEDMFNF